MVAQPLRVADSWLAKIQLVATDMDGTLTCGGKFNSQFLQVLESLAAEHITVLIVTGRSAGWVSGLVNYLPVAGAIAENGGLFYAQTNDTPVLLTAIPDLLIHRQQLAEVFARLQLEFLQLRESADNPFRLTDWTFDVAGLSCDQLQRLEQRCFELGWGFTYSSVQCHIKPLGQDKARGLTQVLGDRFSEYALTQVVTVGDSPNDESLFDAQIFPYSVGVANVKEYLAKLRHQPAYVTDLPEGAGFNQLAELLLRQRIG